MSKRTTSVIYLSGTKEDEREIDFDKMPFMQAVNLTINKRMLSMPSVKVGVFASYIIFWFCVIFPTHYMVNEIIPYLLEAYSWNLRYMCTLGVVFIAIEMSANWLCTVLYTSDYRKTRDNPTREQEDFSYKSYSNRLYKYDGTNGAASPYDKFLSNNGVSAPYGFAERDADYLSWGYCQKCDYKKPPRSHHCPVCNKCILKRDHHCFMTGVCIGYYNQRYFIIGSFYCSLFGFIYFPVACNYISSVFWMTSTWMDFFVPLCYINVVLGYTTLHQAVMVTSVWLVLLGSVMSFTFAVMQFLTTLFGRSKFELEKMTSIESTSTVAENFRDVFGAFWLVNFIVPAVIIFRQPADGTEWPNLRFKGQRANKSPKYDL